MHFILQERNGLKQHIWNIFLIWKAASKGFMKSGKLRVHLKSFILLFKKKKLKIIELKRILTAQFPFVPPVCVSVLWLPSHVGLSAYSSCERSGSFFHPFSSV